MNNIKPQKKYNQINPFFHTVLIHHNNQEINKAIEESAVAKIKGNLAEALEKAKDAYNKEKVFDN